MIYTKKSFFAKSTPFEFEEKKLEDHFCRYAQFLTVFFQVALYYEADQGVITNITKDAKMTWSDKISWIGGNMGLFTGFSLISGFEFLYWITFKA